MRLKNLSILVTLCLSVSGLVAQPKTDYDRKWKIIDSLYNKKGLTESALTEVNKLLLLSRQEHNQPQSIKALIYREVLNSKNENAEEATVKELDSAIVVAPQPARAVLENLLAGVYERYFLGHQWQLRNRSKTVNFVKADMGTWGADDFDSRIGGLYLASLQQQSLLASVKPADFNPILLKGNVPSLRPTLFDLLAHRALDYFTYNIAGTGAAADAFAIEDTVAFGDAAAFARHRWITTDTGSRQYRALTLFQRLIVFHLGDSRPAALIDVDLERLQFVNNNGAMDDKDGMFTHALIRITDKYGDEPAAAEAWYLQAKQYDNVKAKAICDRVIAQKDSSQGKEDCLRLRDELLQKYLTVQTEKINPPGMPMRALVTWSNIDHLYLRLINMDSYTKLPNINIGDPGFWKEIAGRPAYRRFDLALPDDHDYRRHSAEIAIGALPSGSYALLGTADPDSGPGKAVCVQYLYVSGIADFQKGSDYFVVDRNSGRPLGGATVQVWSPDQSTRQQLKKAELYHTDDKGHFILRNDAGKNAYREIALEISTGGDHLFVRDMYASNGPMYYDQAQSEPEKYEEEHQETYFFLDRKIYRPGQTVYFKGVVVTRDKTSHEPKMMAGRKTKVFLYDANSTVVDSLELTANDYGSYHGSFRLPTGRLNGSWRLSDAKNGEASFSVEEYKRPTFYVEYEKQKGGYRLGDSIRVTGNVKAYAGNGLDGASVTYRVIRRSMVRPLYSWGRIVPRGETKEIKHGVVKTDSKGNFSIVFVASPDRMIDRKTDPRWEFEVSADVTDINGETRSGRTSVTTGYTALNLDLRVAGGEHLPSDSLRQLTVGSANLSGEPVNSRVKVSIYPLRSPERLIRQRLWARPDRWLMTEKAFLDSFPHDEYKNELEKESWAKGSAVWEESGATGAASGARFSIPAGRLTPGWYFVEATTTDAYGQEVKDGSYIELYDGRTGKPANPQYSWLSVPEQTVEPGRKARVEVGSSAKEVVVFRHVEHIQQKDSAIGLFTLGGERKTTEFDISETDRGGISVSDVFVKDNRIYSVTHRINVPWTNKELAVRYASYRDKTEPGSKEKWSVTISGQHGDKVSAEVLAAMYDASLDQFESHQWAKPDLYPELSGDRWPWMSSNFVSGYSFMKWEDRGCVRRISKFMTG
ncbi:MG2 domain-containing protein [Puia sp. P3]|uniref:MG2 domain-containing protein n=1 Tax=Puia sp. P3 TaxID=3423952 RepID=UPI003D66C312